MPVYSLNVGHPDTERKQVFKAAIPAGESDSAGQSFHVWSSRRDKWVSLAEEETLSYMMVTPSLMIGHTILASGSKGESLVC